MQTNEPRPRRGEPFRPAPARRRTARQRQRAGRGRGAAELRRQRRGRPGVRSAWLAWGSVGAGLRWRGRRKSGWLGGGRPGRPRAPKLPSAGRSGPGRGTRGLVPGGCEGQWGRRGCAARKKRGRRAGPRGASFPGVLSGSRASCSCASCVGQLLLLKTGRFRGQS